MVEKLLNILNKKLNLQDFIENEKRGFMGKDNQEAPDLKNKDLEEIYRKFLRLYDRSAADRLTVNKQGEALGKIIEELKSEASLVVELKSCLRQDIAETMKETMDVINEQVKKSVRDSITAEVGSSVQEFKFVIDKSTAVLRKHTNEDDSWPWLTHFLVLIFVLTFLCVTYTTIMVRRHIPDSYFTSEQVSTYENGVFLDKLWGRLSKKEQVRLIEIGRGDLPPEEKSLAWIAKQNPGMSNEEIRKKFDEQKE